MTEFDQTDDTHGPGCWRRHPDCAYAALDRLDMWCAVLDFQPEIGWGRGYLKARNDVRGLIDSAGGPQ